MSDQKRPQAQRKGNSQSRVDYARLAAARTLEAVPSEGLSMDEAFNRQAKGLSPRDRGFAWRLVRAAMRHHGPLQHLMTEVLERGRVGLPLFIQGVIRLGLTDLLILETPPHAAVSSTVNLLGTRGTQRYRGMVNAVLRRADRERPDFMKVLHESPVLPHWLADRWNKQWGEDATRACDALARAEAPVDLCLLDQSRTELDGAKRLPSGQFRFDQGFSDFLETPLGQGGKWWVQDYGAHSPIATLGDLSGKTAIDLCCAPGGKTLQLARAGAEVVAVDVSGPRLEKVYQNLERTGLKAAVKKIDVLKYTHKPVDLVVLDAPCSATGTFRKNPEAPWLRSPTTLLENVRLQSSMIDKSVELVKSGGTFLYIVCSMEKEEGENQARRALEKHSTLSLVPFTDDEGLLPGSVTEEGFFRLLPGHYAESGGVDGFFAARFKVA